MPPVLSYGTTALLDAPHIFPPAFDALASVLFPEVMDDPTVLADHGHSKPANGRPLLRPSTVRFAPLINYAATHVFTAL